MAVKLCPLRIDMRQHEIVNHGSPMFPCGGYTVSVGGHITEIIPWHWHEEAEVMFVKSGTLKLDVSGNTVILKEGEAAFINSSVLHTAVNVGNRICEIHSLVFSPQLIFGSLESAIEQKYVRPLVNCPGLAGISFSGGSQWHKEAVKCIKEAFNDYRESAFGYEILVREQLSKLWFLIVSHYQKELGQHGHSNNTEAMRIKAMLGFIHTHYQERISLENIAASAAVSGRECLRCFNKMLSTTPMKYLLKYRISAAAGMLINSDLNITELSKLSGFESPSYFSLMFKKLICMTPKEYRNINKEKNPPL